MPVVAKSYDELVVLDEYAAPFAIRPGKAAWTYHLVGEAYVYGVMDGEVIWDDQFREERITLV